MRVSQHLQAWDIDPSLWGTTVKYRTENQSMPMHIGICSHQADQKNTKLFVSFYGSGVESCPFHSGLEIVFLQKTIPDCCIYLRGFITLNFKKKTHSQHYILL